MSEGNGSNTKAKEKRPAWTKTGAYREGQIVEHGGQYWTAEADNAGLLPPGADPRTWRLFACCRCGEPLNPDSRRTYRDGDEYTTVRCRDERTCRSRKLANDLGLDLYARYPRELLVTLMDVRPPNWKETGWESIFTPEVRVGAALLYFSWCYPVSMPYACQIKTWKEGDEVKEDILLDQFGQPVRQTHTTLAKFLNIDRGQVTKAIGWRQRRKLLREEDSRLYPEPKPQALTPEERAYVCTDTREDNLKDLRAFSEIPKPLRLLFASILAEGQAAGFPDFCTDTKAQAKGICTVFNSGVGALRTHRDQAVRALCTERAIILRRLIDSGEPSSSSGFRSNPAPAKEDNPATTTNETAQVPTQAPSSVQLSVQNQALWDAGLGAGALAKLPSPRPTLHTEASLQAEIDRLRSEQSPGEDYSDGEEEDDEIGIVVETAALDAPDTPPIQERTRIPVEPDPLAPMPDAVFEQAVIQVWVDDGRGALAPSAKQVREMKLPDHPWARPIFVSDLKLKISNIKHGGGMASVAATFSDGWRARLDRAEVERDRQQEAARRAGELVKAQTAALQAELDAIERADRKWSVLGEADKSRLEHAARAKLRDEGRLERMSGEMREQEIDRIARVLLRRELEEQEKGRGSSA